MFDISQTPRIETERLILRGWRESDFESFAAMMADPDVAQFLTANQCAMDRATAWNEMARFVGHWSLRGFGLFVIEERGSGAFVGRAGAWQPQQWVGLELGSGLARAYWGKSYAHEAMRAAGDWVFKQLAPESIVSLIHESNSRSRALAVRLGMQVSYSTLHAGMPHDVWEITGRAWRGG